MLEYPKHQQFARFMRDLNQYYMKHTSMYKYDYDKCGFQWIDCHQEDKCLYLFMRMSEKQRVIAAFNFSNQTQEYDLQLEEYCEKLHVKFFSEWDIYGGNTEEKQK